MTWKAITHTQILLINHYGMYFDALVVEVEKSLLFFRLALAILWEIRLFFIVRIANDLLGFFTVYVIRFFNFDVIKETM